MKRIKVFVTALVISLTVSGSVYAAGNNVLNLDVAVNHAIKNSYSIKNKEDRIQTLKNKFKDDISMSNSIEGRLKNNERFLYLSKKNKRTEQEEEEYKQYLRVYGVPVEDDYQRYELLKLRDDVTALDQFDIFQYASSLEIEKNKITQCVYENYSNLLKLRDQLELQKRKINNFEQEYKKNQTLNSLGSLSKKDYLLMESNYLKEKKSYNDIERKFKEETMKFNKLIGEPLNEQYTYTKDLTLDKIKLNPIDNYIEKAFKNRAEIANGEEFIRIKRFEEGSAEAIYKNEHHRERRMARAYVENAEDTLKLKKIDIKMEINNLYNDIQVKLKKLEIEEKNYKQSKKDYEEIEKRYNMGMLSRLEFDKKSEEFIEKDLNCRNLKRDIYISNLKLENATDKGTDANNVLYNSYNM